MPITYSIDHKTCLEYLNGYRKTPPTARFEKDGYQGDYFDSHRPDPDIVTHSIYCPHHPPGYEYYYRKDQLPEGYVNAVTPKCSDYHVMNHEGKCPWNDYRIAEQMFIDWLKEHGLEPAIRKEPGWDANYQVEVEVLQCPICPPEDQPRFTYCEHGKFVHDMGHAWHLANVPQHFTPECPRNESNPFGNCHWGNWYVCMPYGPRYHMIEYEGCVLGKWEHNGYDDSDFFAVVWDEASQSIRHVEYGSTRYAGGGGCRIDATEAVKEKAYLYACKVYAHQYLDVSVSDSKKVATGKRVRVIKAVRRAKDARNNVPEGMTGTVLRVDDSEWGPRVQFEDDLPFETQDRWQHQHWIAADKLEVIDPNQYVISPDEAWEQGVHAANMIRHQNRWRIVNYVPSPGYICAL